MPAWPVCQLRSHVPRVAVRTMRVLSSFRTNGGETQRVGEKAVCSTRAVGGSVSTHEVR